MTSTQPHHPHPHVKQLQLWQLIVFAYLVWPGLSIRFTLNVMPLQVKFFWSDHFWCILDVRAVIYAFSSVSLLSEFQSYGRPPSRFQVLLNFGDECLDPQRQRRTLTVQVTAAPVLSVIFQTAFISIIAGGGGGQWSLMFTGKLPVFIKSKLSFEKFNVQCWNFEV